MLFVYIMTQKCLKFQQPIIPCMGIFAYRKVSLTQYSSRSLQRITGCSMHSTDVSIQSSQSLKRTATLRTLEGVG